MATCSRFAFPGSMNISARKSRIYAKKAAHVLKLHYGYKYIIPPFRISPWRQEKVGSYFDLQQRTTTGDEWRKDLGWDLQVKSNSKKVLVYLLLWILCNFWTSLNHLLHYLDVHKQILTVVDVLEQLLILADVHKLLLTLVSVSQARKPRLPQSREVTALSQEWVQGRAPQSHSVLGQDGRVPQSQVYSHTEPLLKLLLGPAWKWWNVKVK